MRRFQYSSFDTALWATVFFSLSQVYNFLGYNAYPFFSVEVLQLTLLFCGLLLLVYIAAIWVEHEWIFYGLLLCLFFDFHFGFANRPIWEYLRTPRWIGGTRCPLFNYLSTYYLTIAILKALSLKMAFVSLFNYGLASVLCLGAAYRYRASVAKVLLVLLGVMTIGTVIQFTVKAERLVGVEDGPTLTAEHTPEGNVYLFILDEHAGLRGIPSLDGKGDRLRQSLIDHYQSRGFDLYAGAYSNYFDTHNSIPSLMEQVIFDRNGYDRKITSNVILEHLIAQGYSLRVYQNEAQDFCETLSIQPEKCFEYRTNSVGYIRHLDMDDSDRVFLLLDSFIEAHRSELLKRGMAVFIKVLGRERRYSTGPMAAMAAFEQIKKDIPAAKKGTVFFAHVMMPHYPYVYDQNCRVKPLADWKNRDVDGLGNTMADWKMRQSHYLDQVACADRQMEQIYQEIDRHGLWDQSAIAVLSDHGSRITLSPPTSLSVSGFLPEDWKACFLTFAATKNPTAQRTSGKIVEERIPIQGILRDFFEIAPLTESDSERSGKVYLRKDWNSAELIPYALPLQQN